VPDPTSLPEPDLAVVPRERDVTRHPSTALLVVEIAVSSRTADTTIKPPLYAAASVPDYWVIDVASRRVEIRREPVGREYRALDVLGPQDSAVPLRLDVAPLQLGALFAHRV